MGGEGDHRLMRSQLLASVSRTAVVDALAASYTGTAYVWVEDESLDVLATRGNPLRAPLVAA